MVKLALTITVTALLGAALSCSTTAFAALGTTLAPARAAQQPAAITTQQRHYLSLAQVADREQLERAAVADPRRGWYDARLGDRERYPLATWPAVYPPPS